MGKKTKGKCSKTAFDPNDHIIYKAYVGSHSHGTVVASSDIDIRGVYVQDEDKILSFGYEPVCKPNDNEEYYEVRFFIEQLMLGKETALALLYSPQDCILQKHHSFDLIRDSRDKFLTKYCYNTFARYGISQINKSTGQDKKINSKHKIRKSPLDFCYYEKNGKTYQIQTWLDKYNYLQEDCGLSKLEHIPNAYALYYNPFGDDQVRFRGIIKPQSEVINGEYTDTEVFIDKDGNAVNRESCDVRVSPVPKDWTSELVLYFNKEEYSRHCKEHREYLEFVANVNMDRFVTVEDEEYESQEGQKVNAKNLLHLVRLIDIAGEIPVLKTILVRRPNREYLIELREGKHDLFKIIAIYEEKMIELQKIYAESDLPDVCDPEIGKALVLRVRRTHLQKARIGQTVYLKDGREGILKDIFDKQSFEVHVPKASTHGIACNVIFTEKDVKDGLIQIEYIGSGKLPNLSKNTETISIHDVPYNKGNAKTEENENIGEAYKTSKKKAQPYFHGDTFEGKTVISKL